MCFIVPCFCIYHLRIFSHRISLVGDPNTWKIQCIKKLFLDVLHSQSPSTVSFNDAFYSGMKNDLKCSNTIRSPFCVLHQQCLYISTFSCQAIKQSINQPINQSINQSINQLSDCRPACLTDFDGSGHAPRLPITYKFGNMFLALPLLLSYYLSKKTASLLR